MMMAYQEMWKMFLIGLFWKLVQLFSRNLLFNKGSKLSVVLVHNYTDGFKCPLVARNLEKKSETY